MNNKDPYTLELIHLLTSLDRIDGRGVETLQLLRDKIQGRCLREAFKILRDSHLAEDAVQEMFIGLYFSLGRKRFDPELAKPWLYIRTILRNKCVDIIRQREEKSVPTQPLLPGVEDHIIELLTRGAYSEKLDKQKALRTIKNHFCLSSLPDKAYVDELMCDAGVAPYDREDPIRRVTLTGVYEDNLEIIL